MTYKISTPKLYLLIREHTKAAVRWRLSHSGAQYPEAKKLKALLQEARFRQLDTPYNKEQEP